MESSKKPRVKKKNKTRLFKENDVTLLFGAWMCHTYV